MDLIYLDNNATTQPAPAVLEAMDQTYRTLWSNPSSVHRFGQEARQRIELARQQVAQLLNAKPNELIFTSGGTESNNLALHGVLHSAPKNQSATLITNRVEHSAVREPAEDLARRGQTVRWISVDHDGTVNVAALPNLVDDLTGTVLVSVQWANNETGTIQPVAELSQAVAQLNQTAKENQTPRRVLLHVDATQAAGKLKMDVQDVPVDLLTLAAHKFHGPKGVGVLFVKRGIRIRPLQRGGPQEVDRRGGTENTPGIIGTGVAAQLAADFVADTTQIESLTALRDQFENQLIAALPGTVVNAKAARCGRLWNTSNLGFPRVEAEAILLGLSERGVCASAGAACSSGSLEPSPVLLAMGIDESIAHGSVRFSLSKNTTSQQLDLAIPLIAQVVGRLQQTLPMA